MRKILLADERWFGLPEKLLHIWRAMNEAGQGTWRINEEFVIVRIDFERRERLLESNPEAFFVTPHYKDYPGVIVRLSTVDQIQFRDLLTDGWRLVAPKRLVRDWESKGAKSKEDRG